ncbi:helix-turn-helix transcriptional regulator [Rhodococcus sp. B10]|uniref:helix-turn-helix domain-containing protein n=1 Tax=Rhodococcus sp. B10 TaxID=2695876 RepID=UPI00169032C8|nr:hypothetical protein [Rhodococcus sp. B10]
MVDRKNATAAVAAGTSTTAGILSPERLAQHVNLTRLACGDSASAWVENYWLLRWDLPDGVSYRSSTLPHPACTLSVERGRVRTGVADVGPVVATGVLTRRFDVTIAESGWVFGVKFRPGGFASMTGTSARTLRDVLVAAPSMFAPDAVAALGALGPDDDPDRCAAVADEALSIQDAHVEPAYSAVLSIVATMLNDRTLLRVSDVERACDIGTRHLQRLFERYVGTTPKWVLNRYRIHDAITDLDDGFSGSIADLAARYAWFDQAHFTREFTELVGVPPSDYRSRRLA